MQSNICFECRDGEHENYDDLVKTTIVRNPETKRIEKIIDLCDHHREMYLQDGYIVETSIKH